MSADLVAQLEALGGSLDELAAPVTVAEVRGRTAQRTGDGDGHSEPVAVVAARSHRRSWWLVAAAVLVVGFGVGALALIRRAPSTPPSDTTGTTIEDISLGLFPHGGEAGVLSAGYATPVDVVSAYLAEVTDPARLPAGYAVTGTVVTDVDPVAVIDDDHASVAVSLQTVDDSGDAHVLVQRVRRDPDVWQVTSAVVIADELADVSLADGMLSGTIAARSGGSTTVYAYDLSTGDTLDSTTINATAPVDGVDAAPVGFRLRTGDETTVGLRYWNTVAPSGTYMFANFADRSVTAAPARPTTSAAPPPSTNPPSSSSTSTSPTSPSSSTATTNGERVMRLDDAQPLFPAFQVEPDEQLELDVADNASIRLDAPPKDALDATPWCFVETVGGVEAGTACPNNDIEQRLFIVGLNNSTDGRARLLVAVDPSVGVDIRGCADTPNTAVSTHSNMKVVESAMTDGGPDLTTVFDVPGLDFKPVVATPAPILIPDVYPTNANGQTYGPSDPSGRRQLPDLIVAVGRDGTQGYVKLADLEQPGPASPEEAASFNTADPIDVPLYASDGTTVIGTFRIGG